MSAELLKNYDLVIVGAGPAGLAAAGKAAHLGLENILLLERNPEPGGILNQCIHDGFGLERFGVSLTGPEYIERFLPALDHSGITLKTSAMVLKITPEREVQFADREGLHSVQAGAVILATGCRERTRGAIGVAGTRPAGVYTAGVVQRLVNMENVAVGKRAVILGSGDIGLIMARRLTLEGMEIACVLEKLPYCSGLLRNVRQCLIDYSIPLHLSTTVVEVLGDHHLEAVVAAEVDASGALLPETKRIIACDTLILSVGLIPENELAKACGVRMDPVTGGALVDGSLMTSVPGIFSCGNGLHVHDIVDMVSNEAELAAKNAAEFLKHSLPKQPQIAVLAESGVRYVLPRSLPQNAPSHLSLRVQNPGTDQTMLVTQDGKTLLKKRMRRLSPAEMIRLSLPAVRAGAGELRVSLRQEPQSTAREKSELVCTCCPNGCSLTAVTNAKGKLVITGAICSRGVSFGLSELTDPRRTLTTTVRLKNGAYPLVAVRSAEPVKRTDLRRLVAGLRSVTLTAPVRCGDKVQFNDAEILVSGRAEAVKK